MMNKMIKINLKKYHYLKIKINKLLKYNNYKFKNKRMIAFKKTHKLRLKYNRLQMFWIKKL